MPRNLPVIEPDDRDADRSRADATIHGVVLAAGESRRFGDRNKLLVAVDGVPIVRDAVRTLLAAELDGVTVVLGHEAERVRSALADLDVQFVENERYRQGQGTSVAAGVVAAGDADAVLIALGDMPHVDPASVDRLLEVYRAGAWSALAAAVDGRRGNPVLFDRRHFETLRSLDGDRGGRDVLLGASDGALVETGDPDVLRDVDRPADR